MKSTDAGEGDVEGGECSEQSGLGHEARNDEPQLYDQTGSAVAGDLMLKCLEFLYRAEAALRARLACTE